MGNNFTITVVAQNEKIANANINLAIAEIRRIEALLTTYRNDSQTNIINDNAGIQPVKVDQEVFNLIERCIGISRITQGAFDISYGSIDKSLWNFDKAMTKLPDAETALKMVHLIDYRNIILDKENTTVFLKKAGMRIGFGGIGKGYAAEMAGISPTRVVYLGDRISNFLDHRPAWCEPRAGRHDRAPSPAGVTGVKGGHQRHAALRGRARGPPRRGRAGSRRRACRGTRSSASPRGKRRCRPPWSRRCSPWTCGWC